MGEWPSETWYMSGNSGPWHAISIQSPSWSDGRYFADDVLKCIFVNENLWILLKIPLKFVRKGPINNIPALVQIMAWRRPGDKPFSEPMLVFVLTHICVTRPQWVNANSWSVPKFREKSRIALEKQEKRGRKYIYLCGQYCADWWSDSICRHTDYQDRIQLNVDMRLSLAGLIWRYFFNNVLNLDLSGTQKCCFNT